MGNFCPKCGTANPAESGFCNNCGAPFLKKAKKMPLGLKIALVALLALILGGGGALAFSTIAGGDLFPVSLFFEREDDYYYLGGDTIPSVSFALEERRTVQSTMYVAGDDLETLTLVYSAKGGRQGDDMRRYLGYLCSREGFVMKDGADDSSFRMRTGSSIQAWRNAKKEGYRLVAQADYDEYGYTVTVTLEQGQIGESEGQGESETPQPTEKPDSLPETAQPGQTETPAEETPSIPEYTDTPDFPELVEPPTIEPVLPESTEPPTVPEPTNSPVVLFPTATPVSVTGLLPTATETPSGTIPVIEPAGTPSITPSRGWTEVQNTGFPEGARAWASTDEGGYLVLFSTDEYQPGSTPEARADEFIINMQQQFSGELISEIFEYTFTNGMTVYELAMTGYMEPEFPLTIGFVIFMGETRAYVIVCWAEEATYGNYAGDFVEMANTFTLK